MTSQESNLCDLLNDESFIRWMRGTSSDIEKKSWDKWLHTNNHKHQQLIKEAEKYLMMPFNTIDVEDEIPEEAKRLNTEIAK